MGNDMDQVRNPPPDGFFSRSPVFLGLLLGTLFILGLGIRCYDLTDPLVGTRPLRSAIIARGMYYQGLESAPEWKRDLAVAHWQREVMIEPPVMERLVASAYWLAGGEYLWIAGLLSSLFWIGAGLALFALARDMGYREGGLISIVYYLFLPFAVLESRTFQPDPLMVALIVVSLWAMYRWYLKKTWSTALLAGFMAGLAIFVKTVAFFPILGAWTALILATIGLRRAIRDPQIWALSWLAVMPAALYYIYGTFISGFLVQQFGLRFFPALVQDPAFYIRWLNQIGYKAGFGAFMLALLGVLLLKTNAQRSMAVGMLLGYLAYGLSLPFHIVTHDYYQLPLIPLVAILLAPVAEAIFRQLADLEKGYLLRMAFTIILIFGLSSKLWDVRVTLAQKDNRMEGPFWEEIVEKIGPHASVIGLTQDYGYRMIYYGWHGIQNWFTSGDFEIRELAGNSFEDIFQNLTQQIDGYDYFLITLPREFDQQPELKDLLYGNYAIYDQGGGYLIFDLNQPVVAPP